MSLAVASLKVNLLLSTSNSIVSIVIGLGMDGHAYCSHYY